MNREQIAGLLRELLVEFKRDPHGDDERDTRNDALGNADNTRATDEDERVNDDNTRANTENTRDNAANAKRNASERDNTSDRDREEGRARMKEVTDQIAAITTSLDLTAQTMAAIATPLQAMMTPMTPQTQTSSGGSTASLYLRAPKTLAIQRTFWGTAAEAEEADEKYMTPANLVNFVTHVENVLADFPDASKDVKTRQVIHALRGSARNVVERADVTTVKQVYEVLFESFLVS